MLKRFENNGNLETPSHNRDSITEGNGLLVLSGEISISSVFIKRYTSATDLGKP